MDTLLLTRSDVSRHLDALSLLGAMREAFKADAEGRTVSPQRARAALHPEGTAIAIFPGAVPGVPAYSVKVHAKFPAQTPAIRGLLQLHDLQTGDLLALMDSGQLTAVRTGVVGALGADLFARKDAVTVALIGAGTQASLQLKTLRLVRSLQKVFIHDTVPERAAELAHKLFTQLQLPTRMAASVEEACAEADLVITSTWARQAFLHSRMLRPGTHVTSLGSDEPGKREVSEELLQTAGLFTDHRELAVSSGCLHGTGLGPEAIRGELGEVLAGRRPGRRDDQELTVFAPVGLPLADLVTAWHVYQSARGDEALRRVDFSA